MIREMPLTVARQILETNLPKQEFVSTYYADCERMPLLDVADMLGLQEITIKKYRQAAYKKLAKIY
jgi:uncharacterized protein YjcR